MEHAFTAAWNLRVLNALMQAVNYNEGMLTLMDDFAGKYRRINDMMNVWRGVRVIPLIDQLLDKFCRVVVPYPGGPIFAQLVEHATLNWGTNNTTNWAVAIDLDRGVTAADVVKLLLDDIEYSFEEITGQSSDADDKADYRLIANILAALGFPTLKLEETRVEENPALWSELQFFERFDFFDTKGVGADTCHYHPLAADAEASIHRACPKDYPLDWRDFIGFMPNAAMFSEVETADDNVLYGIMRASATSGYQVKHLHRVYTPEDGWFSTIGALDLTAADSIQDYIWSMPWITRHIFGAMAISSEEPEEEYFMYGPGMDSVKEWIQVHDHLGEGLYIALHRKEFGGFDLPVIH
jgi:hypothetical protein